MSTRRRSDDPDIQLRKPIQRTGRACDECRRRKVRCSGTLPVCHRCKAQGLDCRFKNPVKKRGPSKESLEHRLHKVEALLNSLANTSPELQSIQEDMGSPADHIDGSPDSGNAFTDTPTGDGSYFPAVPASSDLILTKKWRSSTLSNPTRPSKTLEDLSRGLENLCIVDHYGYIRYYGSASGLSFFRKTSYFRERSFNVQDGKEKIAYLEMEKEVDPERSPLIAMPPPDLGKELIQLYFKHCYPLLPLLHKKSFLKKLNSKNDQPSPLLLNAIFAVTSRFSKDERVQSKTGSPYNNGQVFFDRAKELLDKDFDKINLATMQAIMLMSTYQYGVKKGNRAWLYNGMAFRMSQSMGLYRDCDHWNIPAEEREERKRTFWCCFMVDQLTSAYYGRPTTLLEDDCDVTYPSEEDDTSDGSAPILEYMRCAIDLYRIMGRVLRQIYPPTPKGLSSKSAEEVVGLLDEDLDQWQAQLPPAMRYAPLQDHSSHMDTQPPLALCQMHMSFYTIRTLLHRPHIPRVEGSPIVSFPSLEICKSAAYTILNILDNLAREKRLDFIGHYCIECMLAAGATFIYLASSSDARGSYEAKMALKRLLNAFETLDDNWAAATRFRKLFGDLGSDGFLEPNKTDSPNSKDQRQCKTNDTGTKSSIFNEDQIVAQAGRESNPSNKVPTTPSTNTLVNTFSSTYTPMEYSTDNQCNNQQTLPTRENAVPLGMTNWNASYITPNTLYQPHMLQNMEEFTTEFLDFPTLEELFDV